MSRTAIACKGYSWCSPPRGATAGSAHCRRQAAATLRPHPRRGSRLRVPAAAAAALQPSTATAEDASSELTAAKLRLLSAVSATSRGSEASALQRGEVEEAQVAVEAYSCGAELDFALLEGRWHLQYTTASDVLPLVAPPRGPLPPPLRFGRIYQAFSGTEGSGTVQNIIEAEVAPPGLPADLATGVTLVVEAGWEVRTARSIALTFREAGFRNVNPRPALQNLLASPLLPRGWWNQQLLLAIKQLSLRVPLTTRLPDGTSEQRGPVGLNYMLTHLDEDMLIGRAQGNGGVFIFSRDEPPADQCESL